MFAQSSQRVAIVDAQFSQQLFSAARVLFLK